MVYKKRSRYTSTSTTTIQTLNYLFKNSFLSEKSIDTILGVINMVDR